VSPASSSAPNSPIAAARRSWSGASAPSAVSAAGLNAAVPRPAIAAPRIATGSEFACHSSRKASARSTSAATIVRRQPTRSMSAPSSGPSTIAGAISGSSTAAIAHAEPVNS
jgi:hypothetical protein